MLTTSESLSGSGGGGGFRRAERRAAVALTMGKREAREKDVTAPSRWAPICKVGGRVVKKQSTRGRCTRQVIHEIGGCSEVRKSGGLSFIRIPIERDPEVDGRVFVTRPAVLLRTLNPGRQSERKWRRDDVEERGFFRRRYPDGEHLES